MVDTTIDDLIDDCLLEIFSYLSPIERLRIHQVCSRWDVLIQQSWKSYNGLIWGRDNKWYFAGKNSNKYHQFTSISDVTKILKYCGVFIKKFHITNRVVDDATSMTLMRAIVESCINLQKLESQSVSPTPEFLRMIRNCANLEELKIKYIDEDCEEALAMMLNNKEKLKFLSLHFSHELETITGKFLQYLPKDLKELHIIDSDNLKPCVLIPEVKKLDRLRNLRFECQGYRDSIDSDEIVRCISELKLDSLKLYSSTCNSNSFGHLASLVSLKKLDLRYNENLGDDSLIKIAYSCKQLEILDIRNCVKLTNRGIASIGGLENLEELYVSGLINMTDEVFGALPRTLKYIWCCKCKNLKDPGVINLIRRAPKLALLNIPDCPGITISTIAAAIEETENRNNNIILEVHTDQLEGLRSKIESRYHQEINSISPFFRIKIACN